MGDLRESNEDMIVVNLATELTKKLRVVIDQVALLTELATKAADPGEQKDLIHGLSLLSQIGQEILANSSAFFHKGTKPQLHVSEIELDGLMKETFVLLNYKARSKGIELSLDLGLDWPPKLNLDGGKLRQVVFELISHSMDFSDKGRIKLSLARQGELLTFAIADSGRSLSHDDLSNLFNSYNPNEPSNPNHENRLDLAMIKSLVESMGGSISARSNANEGLVFYFTVSCEAKAVPSASRTSGKPTVLIVDDEEIMRQVLGSQIVKLGFDIVYACDGLDGLHKFDPNSMDLIITDVSMPKLNGLQMLKAIQKATPDIKAIVVSGRPETKKIAQGMGATFVDKPYNIPNLLTLIKGLIGREAA